jgi:hypothetical protein
MLALIVWTRPSLAEDVAPQAAPGATAETSVQAPQGDAKDKDQDSKFNPLLIRNNPKAHTYALNLRAPVVVDLGLAKRSAEFTPDQFKKVTEAAQDELFEIAAEYAMRNGKLNGARFYPPHTDYSQGEYVVGPLVKRVREAMTAAMTPEQRDRFEAAVGEQDQFRREACIETIVSRLDVYLVLSDEQREKIAAALEEAWDPNWADSGALQGLYTESLPEIPRELVAPHLDAEQLKAFEARPGNSWHSRDVTLKKIPADLAWDPERHR